jgi:hypothetical protein
MSCLITRRYSHCGAQNRDPHFVRVRAVETHLKISQEPLYMEIYRKNAGDQNRDPHLVRACAVETHVKMSQEQLYTEIYRKNAGAQSEHQHRP